MGFRYFCVTGFCHRGDDYQGHRFRCFCGRISHVETVILIILISGGAASWVSTALPKGNVCSMKST